MRMTVLLTALAGLAFPGAASATPVPAQAGITAPDATIVPVRSTTKKKGKNSKGMGNMKGMDHSKMRM